MSRARVGGAWAVAVTVVLGACGAGAPCAEQGDCPADLACVAGTCVPTPDAVAGSVHSATEGPATPDGGAGEPDAGVGSGSSSTPLVLDLSGKGFQFTSVRTRTVHFDLTGDGQPDVAAWVEARGAATNAFLALDRDGNGRIDTGKELFGNQHGAANGFLELARFDDNADGRIDAADAVFARLRAWVDANGDAVTDRGELRSLRDVHVTAIRLEFATSAERDAHGNGLYQRGVFEKAGGGSGQVVDAWLRLDRRHDVGALW